MFKLSIENYRGFSNEIFDFRKVNILIGENSSGKSSLIKFILTLVKSYNQTNSSFNFSAASIGKYSDFVYEHRNELPISFTIYLGEEYFRFFNKGFDKDKGWKTIVNRLKKSSPEDREVRLKFTFHGDINRTNNVIIEIENNELGKLSITRNPKKDNDSIFEGKSCSLIFDDFEEKIEFNQIGYDQLGFMTHIHGSDLRKQISEKFYPESEENEEDLLYYEMGYLLITQNFFEKLLDDIVYINPLESKPERIYVESEKLGLYPVKNINDVVNILTDETLDATRREELLTRLNNCLRKFGILHQLIPVTSGFGANELRVQIVKDGIQHNIQDVGYGSALQIPIFFQAILSSLSGGELIIIEQPEIHIHPSLQAKFIENIIESGPENTYIIETHSVDLLRKLQVLVKRKALGVNSKNVKIYYFKKSPDSKAVVTKHEINEFGKLDPKFPDGFYDNSIGLINDLLL